MRFPKHVEQLSADHPMRKAWEAQGRPETVDPLAAREDPVEHRLADLEARHAALLATIRTASSVADLRTKASALPTGKAPGAPERP